jgi:hypothetical protein
MFRSFPGFHNRGFAAIYGRSASRFGVRGRSVHGRWTDGLAASRGIEYVVTVVGESAE